MIRCFGRQKRTEVAADVKISDLPVMYSQSYVFLKYARKLSYCEKERYISKLHCCEFTKALPDPYGLNIGWIDDPTKWPHVSYGDAYQYLIETPGQHAHTSLKAYKSLAVPFCFVKSKVVPSQRLREKSFF